MGGDSIFEGEIVRTLRYLDDLLRGMIAASRSIGNNELEDKFKETIEKTRHGIIFATSLYL